VGGCWVTRQQRHPERNPEATNGISDRSVGASKLPIFAAVSENDSPRPWPLKSEQRPESAKEP
jgi:hypothetical protein